MHLAVNSNYIETVVSALSGTTGVTAVPGKNWAFDMAKKQLHYVRQDLLFRPFWFVRALVLHEMGHVMFTQPFPPSQICKDNPQMREVYNAFEDGRVERLLNNKFGSFSESVITLLNKTQLRQHRDEGVEGKPRIFKFLISILGNDLGFSINLPTNKENMEVTHALNQFYTMDRANDFIDKVTKADSFRELADLCDKHLYPIVKDILDDSSGQSSQEKDSDQKNDQDKKEQEKDSDQKNDQDKKEDVSVNPKGGTDIKDAGENDTHFFNAIPSYLEASAMVAGESSTLAHKLRDVLNEQKAIKYSGQHKQGRLLSKNVSKLFTGENRIFSKRNNPDTPDYKVYVILDSSSSMDGSNAVNAYIGGVLLYDMAIKSKLDVEVWNFSDDVTIIARNGVKENIFQHWRTKGGTNDQKMFKELAQSVKKSHKDTIAFVIGDGDGNTLNLADLETVKKSGFLMGIGIGGGCSDVIRQYPNGAVVSNPHDVPKLVLTTMQRLIRR